MFNKQQAKVFYILSRVFGPFKARFGRIMKRLEFKFSKSLKETWKIAWEIIVCQLSDSATWGVEKFLYALWPLPSSVRRKMSLPQRYRWAEGRKPWVRRCNLYKSLQASRSYGRNLNFYEPKTACLRLPQVHSLFSHPRPPSAEKYSHCDNGIQKRYSSQIGGSESRSNTWLYCGAGEAEIYICKSHTKSFAFYDATPRQPSPRNRPLLRWWSLTCATINSSFNIEAQIATKEA